MLQVGAHAIHNGITIDLRRLDQTTLSIKTETASVGASAKWGEVYTTLEIQGYFVPGAEASVRTSLQMMHFIEAKARVTVNTWGRKGSSRFRGLFIILVHFSKKKCGL